MPAGEREEAAAERPRPDGDGMDGSFRRPAGYQARKVKIAARRITLRQVALSPPRARQKRPAAMKAAKAYRA